MTVIKAFRAAMALPLAAALFFLLTPAPPLAAQENALNLPPEPFKPVAVGTKMVWKKLSGDKTGELIITAINGFKINSTYEGKDRTKYIFCMWCTSRGAEIDVKAYAALWPLTVGKTVTIDRVSGRGSWTNKITVAGTEKLTLAFGAVDTYRVVNESSSHNSDWEGVREYWYAPSVGYIVKFKSSDNSGNDYGWEVTGVTKP